MVGPWETSFLHHKPLAACRLLGLCRRRLLWDGALKDSSCPETSAPGFKSNFWRAPETRKGKREETEVSVFPRAWPRSRALPWWTEATVTAQPGWGGGGRCSPGTRVRADMALAPVPGCLVLLKQLGHLHLLQLLKVAGPDGSQELVT